MREVSGDVSLRLDCQEHSIESTWVLDLEFGPFLSFKQFWKCIFMDFGLTETDYFLRMISRYDEVSNAGLPELWSS